jgi:hypothetical protein
MHQEKAEGEPGDLPLQEKSRIVKPVSRHNGARAEHHN